MKGLLPTVPGDYFSIFWIFFLLIFVSGFDRSEWQTRGDYVAFPGGPCVASLVYTVRLMQEGTLRYTYQYPDDDAIFEFQVKIKNFNSEMKKFG